MDQIQNWYNTKIAPIIPPEASSALLFVLACTIVYVRYSSQSKAIQQREEALKKERQRSKQSNEKGSAAAPPPKDIFETMRKQRSKGAATGKQQHSTDKPFGSSYYYAHNTPNAKGGYADGLAAEDYVMNGPKLLSKGGVPVAPKNDSNDDEKEEGSPQTTGKEEDENANEGEDSSSNAVTISRPSSQTSNSKFIPISKYMWDDDGTGGVARIYIETLPSSPSTTAPPLKWEDAGIKKENVEANLIGKDGSGLLVRIRRPKEEEEGGDDKSMMYYQLHVPKMHGQASQIKTIVKSKRLIIKLTKTRNGIWDSGGNTKAWPYLSASTSAAANSIPIDTDDLMNFSGKLNEDEKEGMMDLMKGGGGGFDGMDDKDEMGVFGWDSKLGKPVES